MFCADRSVITTLGEANRLAAKFPAEHVGVVVDAYHVWWDPCVEEEIARARILGFHVDDWILPLPEGALLGRGLPGEGCADLPRLHRRGERRGLRRPDRGRGAQPARVGHAGRRGPGRARRRDRRRDRPGVTEDRALSPFTGWTRAHWERLADDLLAAVRPFASPGPRARAAARAGEPVGRVVGRAGGLRADVPAGRVPRRRRVARRRARRGQRPGLARALAARRRDPAGAGGGGVDRARAARERVWPQLGERVQEQLVEWLGGMRRVDVPANNWVWFRAIVSAFLRSVGADWAPEDLEEAAALTDEWYVGDGWYTDGAGPQLRPLLRLGDALLSAVAQPDLRRAAGAALPSSASIASSRTPSTSWPPTARRCSRAARSRTAGRCSPRSGQARLRRHPAVPRPHPPAGERRRCATSSTPAPSTSAACSRSAGTARSRRCARATPAPDRRTGPPRASPASSSRRTTRSGRPTEEPLELEERDVERTLHAPGWLVSGTAADGIVRIANHGTAREPVAWLSGEHPRHRLADTLYSLLAYSTHAAPVGKPDRGGFETLAIGPRHAASRSQDGVVTTLACCTARGRSGSCTWRNRAGCACPGSHSPARSATAASRATGSSAPSPRCAASPRPASRRTTAPTRSATPPTCPTWRPMPGRASCTPRSSR